jgi:hypothetical protein
MLMRVAARIKLTEKERKKLEELRRGRKNAVRVQERVGV